MPVVWPTGWCRLICEKVGRWSANRIPTSSRPRGDRHAAGAQTALVALASNAAIVIAKLAAFLLTGSAFVLAQTVHSAADTGNEGLLLLGNCRARQEAVQVHPFGYGRLRYFCAFVVSVVLFTAGGVASLLEGVDKLRHPAPGV